MVPLLMFSTAFPPGSPSVNMFDDLYRGGRPFLLVMGERGSRYYMGRKMPIFTRGESDYLIPRDFFRSWITFFDENTLFLVMFPEMSMFLWISFISISGDLFLDEMFIVLSPCFITTKFPFSLRESSMRSLTLISIRGTHFLENM